MPLTLPALDPEGVDELRGSTFPEPFRSRMGDRRKKRLGEVFGLSQFGVNLVTLGPGARSALRHWHTHEDEFVFLLSGEVVLITNAGEQVLKAGTCAGYKAGVADGHYLINRSDQPAQYLEVGSRSEADITTYPDDDLILLRTIDGERVVHKDFTPY